jgi:hypothetical protein
VIRHGLVVDLHSDHAGESGAATSYRSIFVITRDVVYRPVAEKHPATGGF